MFADDFRQALQSAPRRTLPPGECQTADGEVCTICQGSAVDYPAEAAAREAALDVFWRRMVRDVPRDPLVLSPRGRNYRTVSKRKFVKGHLSLLDERKKPMAVPLCAVEPEAHARIYAAIERALPRAGLAPALNWAIIKGSYDEFTVILNVKSLAAEVVRAANPVSKSVTKAVPQVASFYLYEDPTPGDYYMASSHARTHRVWGKSDISIRTCGRQFVYPVTSFSQVNPAVAEQLVVRAEELLQPQSTQQLFDLYCGYGLFALCLSPRVEKVTGVEWGSDAVDAAIQNARRQRVHNARFLTRNIDAGSVQKLLHGLRPQDAVLLDPPRNGTLPDVIESIAAARPGRVVHVFCNIDILPNELARWRRSGYTPRRAIPFDMFPGTDALETMVLLEPVA